MKDVLYFELLKLGEIVTSERYQQLMRLNDEIKQKRFYIGQGIQVILLHDKAQPHSAITKN